MALMTCERVQIGNEMILVHSVLSVDGESRYQFRLDSSVEQTETFTIEDIRKTRIE